MNDLERGPLDRPWRVHPLVDRAAAYSWRLIAIGVVVVALVWLIGRTSVALAPVVVALFATRALSPVAAWLRRHRWRPGLAAAASMLLAGVALLGVVAIAVPSMASEIDSIGPTVTDGLDELEDWLVDDAPLDVSRESIDRLRERAGDAARDLLRSSDGAVLDRATLAAEVLAGLVLAVLLTFFMLRDGSRFVTWACNRATTAERRERWQRASASAWRALGAFLRGAALLGAIESVLIGVTIAIAGGGLVAPIMVLTFLGAFVPVIGAILAGAVAVLVALVTGGLGAAIAVAVVALVVQQLDNDLLAPVIYGRALSLHPVGILLGVVVGGALFGLAGTMLAVPVVAVAVNASKELRATGQVRTAAVEVAGDG